MTKKCYRCKQVKLLEEFSRCRRNTDGLQARCKQCGHELQSADYKAHQELFRRRRAERKAKDPEKLKRYHQDYRLKNYYGMTRSQYDEMLHAQAGKCKICTIPMKEPNVDHCHETGEVRGLLCNNCNRGIGHLKNSIPNLQAAIAYLTPRKATE